MVIDRTWPRHIRYARVVPDASAGTVAVTIEEDGEHSEVTVTYELTALTDATSQQLQDFAAHYPAFLQSWQEAIAACIRSGLGQNPRR